MSSIAQIIALTLCHTAQLQLLVPVLLSAPDRYEFVWGSRWSPDWIVALFMGQELAGERINTKGKSILKRGENLVVLCLAWKVAVAKHEIHLNNSLIIKLLVVSSFPN